MANEEIKDETMTEAGLDAGQTEALKELCNIAFGAAGSSLAVMLNKEISVSPPEVSELEALATMPEPLAGSPKTVVSLNFTQGLTHATVFILKTDDARMIADIILGNAEPSEEPLNDLKISAISEAFSQMMSASANSLASVISEAVEVDAPKVQEYNPEAVAVAVPVLAMSPVVSISVGLVFGDKTIEMVQLMSVQDAQEQVVKLLNAQGDGGKAPEAGPISFDDLAAAADAAGGEATKESNPVTVQPVQFAPFDDQPSVFGEYNKNLDLVLDVTLNLTVQLGATELSIKQILELTRGSVIELDRIAGEPVDLLANGKLIAKGEVVVIEDNFGLRITSIVSPQDRLRGLTG